ncbi:MAG: adenylate/guanylate cyclase domain-containing protein [Rhodospirillales bacterium]|nr:adenylate/guanylate cyclase domain-containing protein [Rhodospirillales bacterium]
MGRLLTHRWIHFLLLFGLLLGAVYYSGSQDRWRKEMQALVFDGLNAMYPREESGQVVIVDIDDDSLLKIGQWPWPRTAVADLVTNLTALGAKVIAFDGVLAEPDRSSPRFVAENLPDEERFTALESEIKALPDHDDLLAQAIEDSGIFVSGFTFGSYSQLPRKPRLTKPFLIKKNDKQEFLERSAHFEKAAVFLPNLEKAAAGNGSFMASPDFDGILRRTGLIFSDGKNLYPSLSLEAIRVAQDNPKLITKIGANPEENKKTIDTNFRILIGDYAVPVEHDGQIWMYYRKFDEKNEKDYLSAYKIIDPAFHDEMRKAVGGKLVLVGSSAEGLKDLRSTALEPFQPGVEIHANALEQILQNSYLLRPEITIVAEATYILFAGLLMIILAPFIHVLVLAFVCLSMIAAAFFGSTVAYVDYKILLDPFYPSLSVFVIFIVSTLLTYLRVESEKHQVRNAFGMYVSRDVMRDLEKHPDKLKLGGENKDLTVMFSDIRSFTTISEGFEPEELIQLMNDFLTAMSDIVMEHEGTIDKYMGDAMMAFWNAPKDVEGHEYKACNAALKMQAALEPINARLREKAQDEGQEPVKLQAGIGLNTGVCAVGNMGSRQRFAYSALGDAVNLASRMEGQTKTYGVQTLIGEETYKNVPTLAALQMDLIQVKGKTLPVRVYALLGDESLSKSAEFKALKEQHEEMIAAYQTGEFKEAQNTLKTCRKLDIYGLIAAYDLYEMRIKELLKNPPKEEWTGVYTAKTK